MGRSVDPVVVWCTFSQAPSWTRDGFCSDCGATDHLTLEQAQQTERDEIDAEQDRQDALRRGGGLPSPAQPRIATDRDEWEPCQKGTRGCCVDHDEEGGDEQSCLAW